MKNLFKFVFDTQIHAIQFLTAILEDNSGSWGYLDYFTVYVLGDIVINPEIPLDGLDSMNCFSELRTAITGK